MNTRVVGNFVGNGLLLIGKFHQCSGEGTHSCFGECSLLLEGTYSWCIYNRYIHRICLNDNGKLLPTTFVPKAKTVKWHLIWSLTLFLRCRLCVFNSLSLSYQRRYLLSSPPIYAHLYSWHTKVVLSEFSSISGPNSMFFIGWCKHFTWRMRISLKRYVSSPYPRSVGILIKNWRRNPSCK